MIHLQQKHVTFFYMIISIVLFLVIRKICNARYLFYVKNSFCLVCFFKQNNNLKKCFIGLNNNIIIIEME